MDADSWTPARGWSKAILSVLIRSAFAFLIAVLMGAAIYGLIRWLSRESQTDIMHVPIAVLLLFGLAGGCLQGLLLAWGLAENSGLVGKYLLPLVIPCAAGVAFAGFFLLVHLLPGWREPFWLLYTAAGMTAAIFAGIRLTLDS